MVWLIILKSTQLFDFDFVDLHSFSYISNVYITHVYCTCLLISMWVELHFHLGTGCVLITLLNSKLKMCSNV